MSWKDVKIGWGRIVCTVAAVILFIYGALVGGLPGFVFFGFPAAILLAICWNGPIADMFAGVVSKAAMESWGEMKKTDLREIHQLTREREYALATERVESIMAKERQHTEAMMCAVNLYRLQDQHEKARQVCLELVMHKGVPIDTLKTLMAQIGMSEEEIMQACGAREREAKRQSFLDALRTNADDHWAAARLIQLMIEEFGEYDEAEKMIHSLARKAGAPTVFLEQMRVNIRQRRAGIGTRQSGNLPRAIIGSQIAAAFETAPSAPSVRPSDDPTIKALLAGKRIGSAVERLEAGLAEFPEDFEGWMLLAGIQFEQCHSLNRAEKAVASIRYSGAFTPEQKAEAEKRLREWKLRRAQSA